MKALLRSSIVVLVLGAGYAAFSMPSMPAKQPTAGMPGLPSPGPCPAPQVK